MGDPKKSKKKYSTPLHPWKKERIDKEREMVKQYGLKNKTEIYKSESKARKFASLAKNLIRDKRKKQAQIETKQLLDKLTKYGFITPESQLENVLEITITNILNRRLQTLVFKKQLANTIKQARQFISHGHIIVNNKKITIPSYMISLEEESTIGFSSSSQYNDKDHPEIQKLIQKSKKEEIKEGSEEVKDE
ncbi:MAG TPA: 30S ribosomal protein S4 [Candidatus Nanoarchaeia archaeon]|nr:30S ribosomal protein S4 [Candidatus Nanoarchaeia archaeon]